jgi:uncharacterized membrane protein YphA (DoxX/SURF4 family)
MNLVRSVARPMLASMFVTGGVDSVRKPAEKAGTAEAIAPSLAARIPVLRDQDTETLVLLNGAVHVGAGTLLALGKLPRLSALALAASLVPTTLAGHRFWEVEDPNARKLQRIQFTKNVGLLGGLLLAAVDTQGKPGVVWRTRHASEHAGAAVRRTRREARSAVRHSRREARMAARTARMAARARGAQLVHQVAA